MTNSQKNRQWREKNPAWAVTVFRYADWPEPKDRNRNVGVFIERVIPCATREEARECARELFRTVKNTYRARVSRFVGSVTIDPLYVRPTPVVKSVPDYRQSFIDNRQKNIVKMQKELDEKFPGQFQCLPDPDLADSIRIIPAVK